jgi:hypothetical protein
MDAVARPPAVARRGSRAVTDAAPNRVDGPVLKFANLVTCPVEL